jgi:hypothetical protein
VVLSLLLKLATNGLFATRAIPSLGSDPLSQAFRAAVISTTMYSPRLAVARGTLAAIVVPRTGDELNETLFSDHEPLMKSTLKLPGVVTDTT